MELPVGCWKGMKQAMGEAVQTILEVKNLAKFFRVKRDFFGGPDKVIRAVDGISFSIGRGETLGLVGESGCGKTTAGRTIMRLYQPDGGEILFKGQDITHGDIQPLRSKIQMVFQDPYASLDPRMTVEDILGEPVDIHRLARGRERKDRIAALLETVGLRKECMGRYPREFSGGQRQRINIARALALQPEFIVCDEPVSALDVSVQAQIVNLLEDLQQSMGLSYLFISHDLSVIKHISRRVGVMYLGKLVELAESRELYERPVHPYTRALLSAVPTVSPAENGKRKQVILAGDLPDPSHPPSGCRFRTRCPFAAEVCAAREPELKEKAPGHLCACHLFSK